MSDIAANLAAVQSRVDEAASRVGREVNLLVVSKTWPTDVVRQVVDAGQSLLGENRLQEGEEKIPQLPEDLEWHFIGGLQRNKVRRVLSLFQVVHSLSSLKLVRFTSRVAGELEVSPKVFLEVNIGEEESKHGFSPDDLRDNLDEVKALMALDNPDALPDFVAERKMNHVRAYNLSKEAVIVLTMAETEALIARDLRMNSVSPAAVSTGILDDFVTAFGERVAKNIARVGRPGLPEEVADIIIFLASPESHWIKGTDIVIDGGMGALAQTDMMGLPKD